MANPPYYQYSFLSQAVQQKEHLFQLYMLQTAEGLANSNQHITVVADQQPNNFGLTAVMDWSVFHGVPSNGNVVGRAQGTHVAAGQKDLQWFNTFFLMFTDARFNGSGLKVDGINSAAQWAIVGGTGEFAGAQGTVTITNFPPATNGEYIRLLHIRVVSPVFTSQIPLNRPIKVVPPKGGKGGDAVDITAKPQRLESVTIRHGDVIDSISYSYIDEVGNMQSAGPWGGKGGLPITINFKSTEVVKKITGTTGTFGGIIVVNSLSIVTNLNTYGPYGKGKGTQFAIPDKASDSVVGFHGRAGLFLDAIGVYASGN